MKNIQFKTFENNFLCYIIAYLEHSLQFFLN